MSHLKKFQDALREKDFDAAIVSDPQNQRYLSHFDMSDGMVLVTQKNAYLLTDFRYIEAAQAQADPAFAIVTPEEGHTAFLHKMLCEESCVRVAVEDQSISFATYNRYCEAFPEQTLVCGASDLLRTLRICKDEEELAIIERAQKITDAAFAHILTVLTPQMTEIEVALELENFMRRNGADGPAFSTIAVSGSNSSRPHGVPRPCKLEKGFLTMDYGAAVEGYCSDMTRTVVIGKADEEMKRLYGTVLQAQRSALEAAAEGVGCRALDKIARDIIDNAGYKGCFGHSLGHGVGLLIHEEPRLSTGAAESVVLQRGNVVTFEPGIYISGKYGCRIEDMLAIRTDGSAYNLTHSPKELIELY